MQEEINDLKENISILKDNEEELLESVYNLTPRIVGKFWKANADGVGGVVTWPHWVVEIVVELMANGTPPASVAANILTICEILIPNQKIVQELPSTGWIRSCRGITNYEAKTLAAYQVAWVEQYRQLFTDDTSKRHIPLQNLTLGWLIKQGFKSVCLNNCILSEDETVEAVTLSLLLAFKEGRRLLDAWRKLQRECSPIARTYGIKSHSPRS